MPEYEPGDVYNFDDGRSEHVVSVNGDEVGWTNGGSFTFATSRDVLQPRVAWSDADSSGERSLHDQIGSLWPLAVGNHTQFVADRTEHGASGVRTSTVENWSCTVDSRQQLDTKAGLFDVWRVGCDFSAREGDEVSGGRRVFYYAPAIRYYVRRDDIADDQTSRTIELTDFLTADPRLPPRAQRARLDTLQTTLEREPSGTSVVWRSRKDEANGEVSPTRTFRAAMAHFCRDYEERIDWQGRQYRVLATACRDPGGRWLVAEQDQVSQKAETPTLRPGG